MGAGSPTPSFTVAPGRWLVLAALAASLTLTACGRARPPLETTPPGLHAPTVTVLEDRTDGGNTVLDLQVLLQPARQDEVRVDYSIEDGSARRGEDYLADAPTGTLVFAAGETIKKIRVTILDDSLYEGRGETFRMVLSNAQGADLAEAVGTITIEDADRPPFAGITAAVDSVPEAPVGTGFNTVTYTVSLDIPSGLPATVKVNSNGDSQATPYGDYVLEDENGQEVTLPLSFTFVPGETEKQFTARIIDDGQAENDEVLILGVEREMDGAIYAPSQEIASVTIEDDDRPDYSQVTTAPRRRLNDTGVVRFAYRIGWDDDGDGGVDRYADDHTWDTPYLQVGDPEVNSAGIVELAFYDGQDALFGVDAEARAATADVNATGFRFTKLGSDGQPLGDQGADYDTTPWHCVRDERTGLVWEVKVPQDSAPVGHGESTTFYWYEADGQANGGERGKAGLPDCGRGTCNVARFVAMANEEAWCGRTGWRLPTLEELRSIADYGNDYNRRENVTPPPSPLDRAFFPYYNPGGPYWTSTPVADVPSQVWGIRFYDVPTDEPVDKGSAAYARLVSGGS